MALGACGDDDTVTTDGPVTHPDGGGDFDAPPAGFQVASVLPAQGPVEGGTLVVVSGTGFASGATVSFGTTDGLNVTYLSEFQLRVETPPATTAGKVPVTVRNPNGASATLPDGFEYRAPNPATIDWCILQHPPSIQVAPGVETESIFAQVWEQGCTEGAQRCNQVTAQIGVGQGTDPTTFTWTDATYNPAHIGDDNDEYMATLTPAAEGTFAYVYRVSLDGGAHWTLCDLGGSSDGFQADQMGALTVANATLSIGWCNLQAPPTLAAAPGAVTDPVYGRVYVAGCSEGGARCDAVTAEVGVAAAGADPISNLAAFTWTPAAFNADYGDNDEYQATLTAGAAGSYVYAYRFSVDSGASWSYCDLSGSSDGLQPEQQGQLTVGTPAVDWCRLQWPPTASILEGGTTEPIFGQTWVNGCTLGDGACAGVSAQLGWGAQGADPSTFTWVNAAYNAAGPTADNDEYMATLTVATAGTYSYAYRFSRDGGGTWTLCDLDGSGNGYDPLQAGALTVGPATPVDWCVLQWPASVSVTAGTSTGLIYGRVYSAGCTNGAGACAGLTAELGWGAQSTDPLVAASYTWVPATFNSDYGNDDEYQAEITPPTAGTYHYVYRFSGNGGASWSYCDLDPGAPPFSLADSGTLTVSGP